MVKDDGPGRTEHGRGKRKQVEIERKKKREKKRERGTKSQKRTAAFYRTEFVQWRKFKIRSASRSITFPPRPTFSTPLLRQGDQSVVFGKKSAADRSLYDEGRALSSPLSSCCSVHTLFRAHTLHIRARTKSPERWRA